MKLEIKSESQYHQIRLSHWKNTLQTPFYPLVYVCCKKAFCLLYQLFWIFDTCYLLILGIILLAKSFLQLNFMIFLRMICLYFQIKDVLLWCL